MIMCRLFIFGWILKQLTEYFRNSLISVITCIIFVRLSKVLCQYGHYKYLRWSTQYGSTYDPLITIKNMIIMFYWNEHKLVRLFLLESYTFELNFGHVIINLLSFLKSRVLCFLNNYSIDWNFQNLILSVTWLLYFASYDKFPSLNINSYPRNTVCHHVTILSHTFCWQN